MDRCGISPAVAVGEVYRPSEGGRQSQPAQSAIALSVIINVVGGKALLRRCLAQLVSQISGRPIEVIVPYDHCAEGVAGLQHEFPSVLFADMGSVRTTCRPGTAAAAHELYDRRRTFGLSTARGDILALLDDSTAPDPDWCDCVLEAHRLPYGVIGGCVEFEGQGVLERAVYLQDFGRYQRPLTEGPASYLTDVNVSYKRHALFAVRELWRERYSEMTVHCALARKGITLWRRPQIAVRQDRGRLSFRRTLVERYGWGKLFGSVRVGEISFFGRLFYIVVSPVLPLILILRLARKTFATSPGRFLLALPYLLLLISSWCLGEFMGYLTGRRRFPKNGLHKLSRETWSI